MRIVSGGQLGCRQRSCRSASMQWFEDVTSLSASRGVQSDKVTAQFQRRDYQVELATALAGPFLGVRTADSCIWDAASATETAAQSAPWGPAAPSPVTAVFGSVCLGRGRHFYGEQQNVETTMLQAALPPGTPVVGLFANGALAALAVIHYQPWSAFQCSMSWLRSLYPWHCEAAAGTSASAAGQSLRLNLTWRITVATMTLQTCQSFATTLCQQDGMASESKIHQCRCVQGSWVRRPAGSTAGARRRRPPSCGPTRPSSPPSA